MTEHTEQPFWERPVSRRSIVTAGIGASALMVAGCGNGRGPDTPDCGDNPPSAEHTETNTKPLGLTANYNWHIPGIERAPDGLRIAPRGVETVPTNLYGARLDAGGDFAIGADVALNRDSVFALQLRDGVALSFDGFVQSPAGIRVILTETGGTVSVWRNEHDPPRNHSFATGHGRQKQIVVERLGEQLAVHVGEQLVGTFDDIFASGRIWFGMAGAGAPSTLRDLTARELPGGTVRVTDTSTLEFPDCPDGLAAKVAQKTAGRREPLTIGTAMRLAPFVENDRYGSLLIGEFDSLTTENAGKFRFLQPQEGRYEFGELDSIVDIAQRHNKDVWLHTLVWHNELPDWVRMKAPEQLKAVMTDHISRVMARTRGKVRGVDVINEPLAEYNGTLRHTPWHAAMGPDYIAIALQAAKQADPDAELWINEYGWDKGNPKDEERFQALFNLAKGLKGRGIRLDGIGLQGHVLKSPRDTANLTVLRRRVDAFATLGVYVRISEIDVTEKAGRKEQAKQMADMLGFAISHPNVTGYTTWGIGGPYVSTANVRNPRVEIRTPWDEQLRPTAIYEALQKAAA